MLPRPVFGRKVVGVLVTAAIVIANGTVASAAPGDLDFTFDQDGRVLTDFTDRKDLSYDVAIQPDGKIVVAGTVNSRGTDARFAIARYDTDGGLDTTFSGDGKVTTNLTPGYDGGYGVALQPDGKIIVVGEAGWGAPAGSRDSKFALVRYDTTGVLDQTFGGDGKVITNVTPGADFGFGVGIQESDGKIVVAGGAGGSGGRIALARFHPGGSLDANFGGDGRVTMNITPGNDRADDLAIQADGKIVVAGTANYFSTRARFVVARFNASGSRDTTFSGDGIVINNLTPTFDGAFSVAIQSSDQGIVVAGQAVVVTPGGSPLFDTPSTDHWTAPSGAGTARS